jgi:hypothetical protein
MPIRFGPENKLSRSDKLIAGFEALAFAKALSAKIGIVKIIHGDSGTTSKVKASAREWSRET